MDIYDNLLEKTIEYINRDNVVENNEIVSAYTLWTILLTKIKHISYIMYDNEFLLEKVNDFYRDMFYTERKTYNDTVKKLNIKVPVFSPCKFNKITSSVEENKLIISLWPDGKKNNDKRIDICKDIDDDNYYGDNIDKYLIETFKHEFAMMFRALEEFAPILKNDKRTSQFITNSTMNITMDYPLNGDLSIDIRLNRNIDPTDSQFKKYYNKPYTINDLINKEKKTILLNTPVEVKSLNYLCSTLVKNHLKEQEKVKQKNKI